MMNTCSICIDEIADGSGHELACGHVFHPACLITWLCRGNPSCPTCRHDLKEHVDSMTVLARAAYLRKTVARRRTAPAELLRLVAKVRDAEQRERDVAAESRVYRSAHKEVLQRASSLRVKRWTARRRTRNAVRVLGVFNSAALSLPALAVYRPLD